MSNFMKIRPVGAELFHGGGQMDRHDEANSWFLKFANPPNDINCGSGKWFNTDSWKHIQYKILVSAVILYISNWQSATGM